MTNAFARIREEVTMPQAAERYGFRVRRGVMKCPFHREKTPSLKVYPGSRGWWCFGCGSGGSVIDFTARLFHLKPVEAAKKLDADFRLGVMDGLWSAAAADRWRAEKERREAEKRRGEQLWRKNRDIYRNTVHQLHRAAPGPERAEILARLAYMDHWFDTYEKNVRRGGEAGWNLHTQRKTS